MASTCDSRFQKRKSVAWAEWRRKVDETALRGLAAGVSLDHDDPDAAASRRSSARELVTDERWADCLRPPVRRYPRPA